MNEIMDRTRTQSPEVPPYFVPGTPVSAAARAAANSPQISSSAFSTPSRSSVSSISEAYDQPDVFVGFQPSTVEGLAMSPWSQSLANRLAPLLPSTPTRSVRSSEASSPALSRPPSCSSSPGPPPRPPASSNQQEPTEYVSFSQRETSFEGVTTERNTKNAPFPARRVYSAAAAYFRTSSASFQDETSKMTRQEERKTVSEPGGIWSTISAAQGVTAAFNKLRQMTNRYVSKEVNEDPPDILDTSDESYGDDKEEIAHHGLDLNELVEEIKAGKTGGVEERKAGEKKVELEWPVEGREQNFPPRRLPRPESIVSHDTNGISLPPALVEQGAAISATGIKKPTPIQVISTDEPVHQPGLPPLPPKAPPRPSAPSEISQVSPELLHIQQLSEDITALPDRSRAMTPIMRMRHSEIQESVVMCDTEAEAVKANAEKAEAVTAKLEEDLIALQQHKWKGNIKREKDQHEGGKGARKKTKRSKRGSKLPRRYDDMSRPFSCQNGHGIHRIIEKLARCVLADDTISVNDDYTEDEYDESLYSYFTESSAEERNEKSGQEESLSYYDEESSRKSMSASLSDARSPELSDIGMQDKNFIKAFVATAAVKGIVLLFHTKQMGESFSEPMRVVAHIRFGRATANGVYSEPRLVWESEDGRVPKGAVELFDIRSLDRATALDVESHPLAMPRRSMVLRTARGTNYIFEALDDYAALRFVHGVRWVVARLSFNLVIGNLQVGCELLDVDTWGVEGRYTPEEELHLTKAMNDITNHLVDKSTAM